MKQILYIVTDTAEEDLAELLAEPLRTAGFDVMHYGTIQIGESSIGALTKLLSQGIPIVLCATRQAVGSEWAHQLINAAHSTPGSRVYVVKMDKHAYIDQLSLHTKPAMYYKDPGQACRELIASISAHYPPQAEPDPAVFSGAAQFLDGQTEVTTFDFSALSRFREQLRPELKARFPADLAPWDFLEMAHLLYQKVLTRTGVLLIGTYPSATLPTALVQCSHYRGADRSAEREVVQIEGTVPAQIIGARQFVADRVQRGEAPSETQAQATPIFDYPMVAVREIIANALVHRDYELPGSCVHVRLFNDRLEIISPGQWFGGRLAEDIPLGLAALEGESRRRNFRLAHVLAWIRLVEGEGSGIPAAIADCKNVGAPEPEVISSQDSVTVVVRPRRRVHEYDPEYREGVQAQRRSRSSDVSPASNVTDIEFAKRYLSSVVHRLGSMEILGIPIEANLLRYPLSIAFELPNVTIGPAQRLRRVDEVLSEAPRLLLCGSPGSGKTTLLQWIAVQTATAAVSGQHEAVPFFLQMRRYATGDLPSPDYFVERLGSHLASLMPAGWVHRQLISGNALILLDGIDEVGQTRRNEIRRWILDLVAAFPGARYVVTSRPAAISSQYFLEEEDFEIAMLAPMTFSDMYKLVHSWHQALGGTGEQEEALIKTIESRPFLRDLASSPLMCALLCTVNAERRINMPNNRIDLYSLLLDVLIDRRDRERGIVPGTALGHAQISFVLGDLAYWMMRNGVADVESSRLINRIRDMMIMMPQAREDASNVYQYLVERTGILRELGPKHVEFIHPTLRQFLAARGALWADDIDVLIAQAHLPAWREIVLFAVAYAPYRICEWLINGLLDRTESTPEHREILIKLAIECTDTVGNLSVDTYQRVQAARRNLE